jgi:hypothetical protein
MSLRRLYSSALSCAHGFKAALWMIANARTAVACLAELPRVAHVLLSDAQGLARTVQFPRNDHGTFVSFSSGFGVLSGVIAGSASRRWLPSGQALTGVAQWTARSPRGFGRRCFHFRVVPVCSGRGPSSLGCCASAERSGTRRSLASVGGECTAFSGRSRRSPGPVRGGESTDGTKARR